jgi:hypothetical protein
MAHAQQAASGRRAQTSSGESAYLASQWRWLLGTAGPASGATALSPVWQGGDQVMMPLQPASTPAWVLFKASSLPGWSATLETPSGAQPVGLTTGELDYMLVRLDRIPEGSRLVLRFGPTWRVQLWWALSAVGGLLCGAWLLRPRVLTSPGGRAEGQDHAGMVERGRLTL